MRLIFVIGALLLSSGFVRASDYGDKDCNIFVSSAGNVITGGYGNYISASVVVSKALIDKDFKNYQVKILNFENAKPIRVEDKGRFFVFVFDKYRKGVEHSSGAANVEAYITNGIDRLFDNNDNVSLVREHNWYYTNQRCKL